MHGDNTAFRDHALDGRDGRAQFVNRIVAQYATTVRAGQDAQWPVVGRRLVEMNTQSQHLVENRGRRMRIWDTLFYRPWPPTGDFPAFAS